MIKSKEVEQWKMILIRTSVMLLLLSISRWLLYIFNTGSFDDLTFSELIRLYFVGLRFDLHPLLVFNAPFLIFYGLPFKFKYKNGYKKTIDIIFIITNSIAISLNLIDVIYFRYLDRRMSSELFTFFKGTDENQGGLIMSFITDFWYMFLIFFVMLFVIIFITKKTKLKKTYTINNKSWYITQSIRFVIIIALSVLGIRGGFQLKPMSLLTATEYTSAENTSLVINTPFSIIMGVTSAELDEISYFDEEVIDSMYSPVHNSLNSNRYIKSQSHNSNVVLIILESFGQEMIGYYNSGYENSLTPFLDSLFNESLVFDGMANGRRSIEALPSILCGLPSLMPTDFPTSRYAINKLEGFGTVLKKHGYKTSFFHGGNNGTMSFNASSKSSGFDDYYGRNEYNDDSDFDGTWGIYDDKFLQFTAEKLNEYDRPFATAIFTLSSHHPYSLPDYYATKDKSSSTPFEKTIRYVDDALRKFFSSISKYEWFKNTIFIITADHVNPEHKFDIYNNPRGNYQVPIAFYAPEIIEKNNTGEIAQHIDIGVSLLSVLNIEDTVFSFGRNVFDSLQKPSHISLYNNIYQYCDGQYFIQSNIEEIISVFDIRKDKNLSNNIYYKDDTLWSQIDEDFKLRLQQYNNRMINNKLHKDEK